MSSQKDSAGRGMLAGLIREIDSLEAVLECEDGLTKMGKRTIQNTINWMKDRANSYAKMNAKLNGGATPFPERCPEGVTPFYEGVPEVSERCIEGVPEVHTKEKVRKGKVMEEKGREGNPPTPLQAPPGFVEPGERFEQSMKGSLVKYGDMWQQAYIAKKKGKPAWVPGMLRYAEGLTQFTDEQVKAGLKAFFQIEGKYVKQHDFTHFCQNALRFINEGINPENETDIRATNQYFEGQK